MAHPSTALRCLGIGFEAVHGHALFAKQLAGHMSRHVLSVNVTVHRPIFLDEVVDISGATVVMI